MPTSVILEPSRSSSNGGRLTTNRALQPCALAQAPSPLRLDRLRSRAALFEHREAWRELCNVHGGAIEQWEWIDACLGDSPQAEILILRESDRIVAAAPLGRIRRRGLTWLEAIGSDTHFEPMSFVAAHEDALNNLCAAVARQRSPLVLHRLIADSPTVVALRRAYAGRALVRVTPQSAAPWIALDESWKSPESHLNSGRRSDLRRARKRADELGAVEFQILCPPLADLPRLLDEAIAVEERSWKGDEKTALARDAARGEFFRRYAESACREGCLRLCFMRIGGQAVAMQIAVQQSRRLWLLKVGYDDQFSRCSPGMLLTRETIAYAASQELSTYEFLGTCEPWTTVWTELRRECIQLKAYPRTAPGVLAVAVDGAAAACIRTKRAARGGIQSIRRTTKSIVGSIVARAARRYIAGPTVADALSVRKRMDVTGLQTTLGFWDGEGDTPADVARQYLEALESMRGAPAHAYLSIKLPALGDNGNLLNEVARKAEEIGCRLHFDALEPKHVARTQKTIEDLRGRFPGLQIGYTLPGRWTRSLSDADWAVERGLPVRVVKGQFSGDAGDEADPRRGFLEVVSRLAGRASHVDIATHDEPLAQEAASLLASAGTPFDREQLFGMARQREAAGASAQRIYIPYGAAYLPYAVARLRKNPRLAGRLLLDALRSPFRG